MGTKAEQRVLASLQQCTRNNSQLLYTYHRDSNTHALFHCNLHGTWESLCDYVYRGGNCPHCDAGSNTTEKLYEYMYLFKVEGAIEFTGFGVTQQLDIRLRAHRANFKHAGSFVTKSEVFKVALGSAKYLEKAVKTKFPRVSGPTIVGFRTESTDTEQYNNVVAYVKKCIHMRECLAESMSRGADSQYKETLAQKLEQWQAVDEDQCEMLENNV